MRLEPIALRQWRDWNALLRVADLQTRTTHGSAIPLAAYRILAELMADAIAASRLDQILASPPASTIKDELCGNLGDAVIRRRSVLACW